MVRSTLSKPLKAWIVGLIITIAVEAYLAHVFFGATCSAPVLAQLVVLVAIPGVYLSLMYLTLRSDR